MATYDRFAGIDDNYLFPPEVMTAIAGGSAFSNKYYTKTQSNTMLDGKSDLDHNHDSRYYTQAQTDNMVDEKVDGVFTPTHLGTTINLNDATVVGADYTQSVNANATTAMNYPIQQAGNLSVMQYSTDPDRVIQRYTTYKLRVFYRYRYVGVWSAWEEPGVQKDTGWRDIKTLISGMNFDGPADMAHMRRLGDMVDITIRGTVVGGVGILATLPTGFGGKGYGGRLTAVNVTKGVVGAYVSSTSWRTLNAVGTSASTGDVLITFGSYYTPDAWPLSPPGDPI